LETDGTLIERSARGRPDAFVEVVRRHEVAVHGFLARRAGRQVADDLLGEIWTRAFAGRDGFDPGRHQDARPWLYGIARNVLRAYWRGGRPADQPTARQIGHVGRAELATDPWDDVIDRLDSAAQARTLTGALPPAELEVLLLVAWEQLTPAQAAAVLGIPPGTARSRLHRARAALRPVLTRAGEDP
jgi:RNA polymerase sigma-70 factor (ECF subfamily)